MTTYQTRRQELRTNVTDLVRHVQTGEKDAADVVQELMLLFDTTADGSLSIMPPYGTSQFTALNDAKAHSTTMLNTVLLSPVKSMLRYIRNVVLFIVGGICTIVVLGYGMKIFLTVGRALWDYM